ncbi:hypothetical protein [Methylobacterium oxalidis]|uniref:Uncharacterized protein n=1 Tax=Methylobacterium oxalidis TaxID=944322 RepID=A0A512JAL9_9HYPH|nr:hypothetical protein [Methylobacterium oxalidis]GEP07010.1 hypothetical protein MOX02_50480 [Methylobacterium oxalidis]GJE29842.1 hypothetical protein LDDCCGHA_0004 [Methylobacterium oxalidis]GLS64637.1 hypothetical protein GCM10007888_30180 [Methylobacterium oxalidis]
MSLRLQPIRVRTGSTDAESQLVFENGSLVAVLTHLSDEYGDEAGMWFLEAGFGPLDDPYPPKFADLDEAQDWITRKLAAFPAHGAAGGAP